eukprot:jgi/Picre1/35787/NNA_003247.t1
MDELNISDPQSWNCAICQELLYKPVANGQYGHFPAIANKLHCFLKASFPEQYASRASEVVTEEEESDVASPETTVPLVLHSSPGKPVLEGLYIFREECESRAREVSEVSGIDPESLMIASPRTAMLCKSRQEETDIHDMYPSDLNDMLDRTFGGADTSTTEGVERMATRFLTSWLDKSDYPHFGVGCDACGQYPILGKRYKCTDCPESVGFDICGTCYDRGVGDVLGRFNQRHTPDHHLELVPPSITKLHVLKAMHPELDFDKLLSLIEMSWEDEGGASGPSNTRNPSAPDSEEHEKVHL